MDKRKVQFWEYGIYHIDNCTTPNGFSIVKVAIFLMPTLEPAL